MKIRNRLKNRFKNYKVGNISKIYQKKKATELGFQQEMDDTLKGLTGHGLMKGLFTKV